MAALTRLTPERRRRFRENREQERDDTVRFLRDPGCAACRAVADACRYWLTAYINEMHTDADVVRRVRRSLGLCPAHTRMLVSDVSESWITPSLFHDALNQGLGLLGGNAAPVLECPVCGNVTRAERTAYERIQRTIAEPAVRAAYEKAGGLCLPHTVGLLGVLPPAYAQLVVETAMARLSGEPTVDTLASVDADATSRAGLYRPDLLPAEQAALDRSLTVLLGRDLRAGCCPLCRRYARTSHRYLAWLAAGDGSRRPIVEDATVCARHLHELTRLDADGAAWVRDQARAQWRTRFGRFTERLSALPSGRFRGTVAAYRSLATWLADQPRCRACSAAEGAAERTQREIGIALRDDHLNAAYGRAHGVCVRHALTWRGDGTERVREVAAAHAAAMAYELNELLRKNSWSTRFEAHGAEATAERRAPTVLDGRIYGGLSAAETDFGDAVAAPPVKTTRNNAGTPKSGPVRPARPGAVHGDAS